MFDQLALQNYLRSKFADLRKKNPAFSQRAFAKKIGLSPGALSGILNAKRVVSFTVAEKILNKLDGDPFEKNEILKHFSKKAMLKSLSSLTDAEKQVGETITLSEDEFKKISTWVHYAILSLVKTKDFQADEQWIGTRLGISTAQAQKTFSDLSLLGIIHKNELGKWFRSNSRIKTTDGIPSQALRDFYKHNMEHSKQKLDEVILENRDFVTCTFPADPTLLPEAKKLVRRFTDEISDFMEQNNCTEVYQLGIQLYPLTILKEQ